MDIKDVEIESLKEQIELLKSMNDTLIDIANKQNEIIHDSNTIINIAHEKKDTRNNRFTFRIFVSILIAGVSLIAFFYYCYFFST